MDRPANSVDPPKRLERINSSVPDLQSYRYKPRDPPASREMPPPREMPPSRDVPPNRDSSRGVPSRDFLRDSSSTRSPRDSSRDTTPRESPNDLQRLNLRDNIGLVIFISLFDEIFV